jgi:hypothetical protein
LVAVLEPRHRRALLHDLTFFHEDLGDPAGDFGRDLGIDLGHHVSGRGQLDLRLGRRDHRDLAGADLGSEQRILGARVGHEVPEHRQRHCDTEPYPEPAQLALRLARRSVNAERR